MKLLKMELHPRITRFSSYRSRTLHHLCPAPSIMIAETLLGIPGQVPEVVEVFKETELIVLKMDLPSHWQMPMHLSLSNTILITTIAVGVVIATVVVAIIITTIIMEVATIVMQQAPVMVPVPSVPLDRKI